MTILQLALTKLLTSFRAQDFLYYVCVMWTSANMNQTCFKHILICFLAKYSHWTNYLIRETTTTATTTTKLHYGWIRINSFSKIHSQLNKLFDKRNNNKKNNYITAESELLVSAKYMGHLRRSFNVLLNERYVKTDTGGKNLIWWNLVVHIEIKSFLFSKYRWLFQINQQNKKTIFFPI